MGAPLACFLVVFVLNSLARFRRTAIRPRRATAITGAGFINLQKIIHVADAI
jgi:hypothetical protein